MINNLVYQALLESVNQKIPIYHYVFNMKNLNNILKMGKLLPINQLIDTNKDDYNVYIKRDINYLETTYNKFYKNILNKPYDNNYGIYLTPVDLFSFPNQLTHRFTFTINDLDLSKTVIKIRSNVQLLTQKNLNQISLKYSNPKEIEEIYNSPSLKFILLPQIVTFSDYLKVSKNNLEIYNRNGN
jgi:hypothetical protein